MCKRQELNKKNPYLNGAVLHASGIFCDHLLRELRDIMLNLTVASHEPLNIALDSCFISDYFRLVQEQLLELQRH